MMENASVDPCEEAVVSLVEQVQVGCITILRDKTWGGGNGRVGDEEVR